MTTKGPKDDEDGASTNTERQNCEGRDKLLRMSLRVHMRLNRVEMASQAKIDRIQQCPG